MYEETQAIQERRRKLRFFREGAIRSEGKEADFGKQEVKRPIAKSSSEQEHKVNALASGADEGRDKLR